MGPAPSSSSIKSRANINGSARSSLNHLSASLEINFSTTEERAQSLRVATDQIQAEAHLAINMNSSTRHSQPLMDTEQRSADDRRHWSAGALKIATYSKPSLLEHQPGTASLIPSLPCPSSQDMQQELASQPPFRCDLNGAELLHPLMMDSVESQSTLLHEFQAQFSGVGNCEPHQSKELYFEAAMEHAPAPSHLLMMHDDAFDRSSIFNYGEADDCFARDFLYLDDCNSSGRQRGLFF